MTTPDLNKLRQRVLGGQPTPPPRATGYQPLPGYSSSSPSAGVLANAWAAFQRRFSLLFRFFAWFRTTAALPDSRMGRMAAWADATGDRLFFKSMVAGSLVGVAVAAVVWHLDNRSDMSYLVSSMFGGAMAGAFFGFFVNLHVFGLIMYAARYWKWVVGYLAFVILVFFPRIVAALRALWV